MVFCATCVYNPLSATPRKWSNTLKQLVGKLPTSFLSMFDHFLGLALKRLICLHSSDSEFLI